MFGYIKTNKEELLVRDYALYRAVYCGLCKEIKRKISFFLPFSLSYDFVFLAIARDMLEENDIKIQKGRCPYNPFKKKPSFHHPELNLPQKQPLCWLKKTSKTKDTTRMQGFSPLSYSRCKNI